MKKTLPILVFTFIFFNLNAQNLYDEKFDNCHLTSFCLDCGDTKAQPQNTILDEIIANLNTSNFSKANGKIEVQILVDADGKPCLISAKNETNISSKKLNLQKAINNTSYWNPAISKNQNQNSSVSLILELQHGVLTAKRKVFDFKNQSNMKSEGTPNIKGSKKSDLKYSWTLYNQQNSQLPWDMTRAISTDLNDNIWIGTDNGIVKIENGNWKLYNHLNTTIETTKYNKNQIESVRYMNVDKADNKWFIAGYNLYKFDNKNWTKYDSINSTISWGRNLHTDFENNLWVTSWKGISKFDGKNWKLFNKENSNLPTNKVLGIYVDRNKKIWVGTFEGNVVIENGKTMLLNDRSSPLSKAYINKMYEDTKGNMWFQLYKDQSNDAGIYVLDRHGKWTKIEYSDTKMFYENSINDFLLDEDKNELWLTLNGIGVLKYDLNEKKWEVYTNQNSNIPSIHAEQITKDKNGDIWVATYAGVVKLNRSDN